MKARILSKQFLLGVAALAATAVPSAANADATITWPSTQPIPAINDFQAELNGLGLWNYASTPEPATWAMMLLGFGAIGMAVQRRRHPALAQVA
jgi:hypothetical protein